MDGGFKGIPKGGPCTNFFTSSLGNLTRGPVSCMGELAAALLLGSWAE